MSARTRTLTQLRDGVSDRANVPVAASGVRHLHSVVDARINRAIQRWLSLVAECGDDTSLLTSRTTTATSATRDAANWAPQMYIAAPTGCMQIRGIDIWDGSTPVAMLPASEMERSEYRDTLPWLSGTGTGFPVCYRLGGTNAASASIIQIFPWADAVYTVDVRYLKAHVDLTTGTDTVDFIAGGEEWVINDAAAQSLISDGVAGSPELRAIMGWNEKIEKALRFSLACRGGGVRKADTRGQRRSLVALGTSRWRTA